MKKSGLNIQDNLSSTKVKHLTDALYDAINQGKYLTGQALPSVNQLSREYNLSRDTVFKAYRELKKRGIVDSTPAKGYHVASMMNKVLLMLDIYSPFKDVLYNSFVSRLPKNFKVDLVFHFYNEHLFETVIADSIGRYNFYVIMNFSNEILHESLRKIDPAKLLILDLGDFEKNDFAFVCQDFGSSVYTCLKENIGIIRKYQRFVLYLPEESEHPKILIRYFRQFAKDHKIEAEVVGKAGKLNLTKGSAYLIINQKDLVETVKRCRTEKLKIGKDIGLIAYNDTPMYEIIENGITVISTDFALMGKKSATFIKTREKVREVIPARMIVRGSM
jgi:DNA-binding transcriptional regulator YhcF (GntR family)